MKNTNPSKEKDPVPELKAVSSFDEYAKNIELFNRSLNDAFLAIYRRLDAIERKVDSFKMMGNQSIDALADRVYTQVLQKVANTQINKDEIVNAIKADYDSRIANIYDYSNKLATTVNSLIQKVTALESGLNEVKSKDYSGQLMQLTQKITDLTAEINEVKDEINKDKEGTEKKLNEMNESVQNKINELEGKINKISDDLYKGIPQINDLSQRTIKLEEKVTDLDSTVQRLVSVVNSDTLDVTSFKTRLDTIATQMNALNDVVTKAQKDILDFIKYSNSLVSILSKLNPDVLQTSIKNLENAVAGIQAQVNKIVDNINALQGEIATLKAKPEVPKQ